jgi:hypothetical protein
VGGERREGGVLVLVHHAAVTRHIGGEDGDELALERRGFHDSKLRQGWWNGEGYSPETPQGQCCSRTVAWIIEFF